MREMYPEVTSDMRIGDSVADRDALRGKPLQTVGNATLVYVRDVGELCVWSDTSVAVDADGVAYVPTFVSDTTEYQDDPTSVAGRFLVHSVGLATSAPMTGMYLPVRVATTGNLVATLQSDGVTLLADANGAMSTIDGVIMAVGDRVLVDAQTDPVANGIYVITSLGGASAKYTLVRAPDMFHAAAVVPEAHVAVLSGTTNATRVFAVVASTPVTLGTTEITFRALSPSSGSYIPVRAATTANLSATLQSDNLTLLADANGALAAVDGVTLVVGDRVLIKSQTADTANGIYTLIALGAGGSKYSFKRAYDMASGPSVLDGAIVNVRAGTLNAGRNFAVVVTAPVTLGTTSILFKPLNQEFALTLVLGAGVISSAWVTAFTGVIVELTTPGGTMGTRLKVAKVAGAGTGTVTITAVDTAGALVNTDTSTLAVKLV